MLHPVSREGLGLSGRRASHYCSPHLHRHNRKPGANKLFNLSTKQEPHPSVPRQGLSRWVSEATPMQVPESAHTIITKGRQLVPCRLVLQDPRTAGHTQTVAPAEDSRGTQLTRSGAPAWPTRLQAPWHRVSLSNLICKKVIQVEKVWK